MFPCMKPPRWRGRLLLCSVAAAAAGTHGARDNAGDISLALAHCVAHRGREVKTLEGEPTQITTFPLLLFFFVYPLTSVAYENASHRDAKHTKGSPVRQIGTMFPTPLNAR